MTKTAESLAGTKEVMTDGHLAEEMAAPKAGTMAGHWGTVKALALDSGKAKW